MSAQARVRSPFLVTKSRIEDYRLEDVLDACTPEELSTATWGLLIQQVMGDPAWSGVGTKTFFITRRRVDALQDLIPDAPLGLPMCRVVARKLVDGAVARLAHGYLVGGLPLAAACALPVSVAVAPVLTSVAYEWRGWAIPGFGPSKPVLLTDTNAVMEATGYETEYEATDKDRDIIEAYGFNPIPHFRRTLEARVRLPHE